MSPVLTQAGFAKKGRKETHDKGIGHTGELSRVLPIRER